jgi:NAD(P)-dependent dehydrogenase (short-subunit alcohol dehydrogenase family)
MPDPSETRIYLVTGASSGLGREVAVRLGADGANIVALGRNENRLAETRDRVEAAGGRCLCVPLDLTDFGSYAKLFEALKAQIPHLDGIAHIAGSLRFCSPMQYVKADDFRQMLDIHLTAPNLLTQAMLPLLTRADRATVIFTTCDMIDRDIPNWHGYGMAKRALGAAAAMWQAEHPDTGLRFYAVNPGNMRTSLFQRAYPGMAPDEVPPPSVAAEAFARLLAGEGDEAGGSCLGTEAWLAAHRRT